MTKFRIIPSLLCRGASLVKTVQFDNPRIVGDVASAIKVFAARQSDEIIILDISSNDPDPINPNLISSIQKYANMPVTLGGGVNTLNKASELIKSCSDKIIFNRPCYFNK